MKTIYKYSLEVKTNQILKIPKGFEIINVDNQFELPTIWALVDTENEFEEIHIEIHGTGNPIHYGMGVVRNHLGTVLIGSYVWHVFHRAN